MALKEPFISYPWWIKAIVTALLGALSVGIADSYTNNQANTRNDAAQLISQIRAIQLAQTGLEAHQNDDHEQIKALHNDMEYIKKHLDDLSLWAMGHK